MRVKPNRAGIFLGSGLGLYHAVWSVLVAAHLAQPLLYFVLYMHFLTVPVRVEPFEFPRAAGLVLFTGLLGYVVGAGLALLWNAVHPRHHHDRQN